MKKINSLEGFLKAIEGFSKQKTMLFRGQSNSEWKVESSAYRRTEGKDVIDYNISLLEKARHYKQEIDKDVSDIELLAKLQHQGAATNLIDFTSNALIALWFACEDKKTDGKVFCLNTASTDKFLEVSHKDEKKSIGDILNLNIRKQENTKPQQTDTVAHYDNIEFGKWKPPLINNRILKQDSIFVFNTSGKIDDDEFEKTLLIPKGKKEVIRKQLETLSNLTEETIFPDFQGFAANNGAGNPLSSTDSDSTSQNAEQLFYQGLEADQQGDYDKAIKCYSEAIELNPKLTEAYYNRGNVYNEKGVYDQAIADYSKAIELDPKLTVAYVNRGNAYNDKKNMTKP